MDINELKKYTKNLDSYTAREVEELTFMTIEEFEKYQYEIEHDTGNTSTWDDIRAIFTLKHQIERLEKVIKNAIHFLANNSGTYDNPRRLTIGEMTELYDLLNSQSDNS